MSSKNVGWSSCAKQGDSNLQPMVEETKGEIDLLLIYSMNDELVDNESEVTG